MTSWQWLESDPAAVAQYIRRRMVPYEYVRLVEWLRVRAPFNHSCETDRTRDAAR